VERRVSAIIFVLAWEESENWKSERLNWVCKRWVGRERWKQRIWWTKESLFPFQFQSRIQVMGVVLVCLNWLSCVMVLDQCCF